MSRRRGEMTSKMKRRDWPHQVETIIPERGLGNQLNEMHSWAHQRTPDYQTVPADRLPIQAMRWCFRGEADAGAFQLRWGGTLIAPPPPDPYNPSDPLTWGLRRRR